MKTYKHVLYAVDLQQHIEKLMTPVLTAAKESGTKMTVLHVVCPVASLYAAGYYIAGDAFLELEKNMREEAEKKLRAIVGTEANIKVEVAVADSPREYVVKQAQDLGVDAIYLNGHDHNILGRLGSTADYVINNADCDVVVLRQPRQK